MKELKVYVVSGYTTFYSAETPAKEKFELVKGKAEVSTSHTFQDIKLAPAKQGKLPTLQEVVSAIQKDLTAAGVSEWSATIELEIKVGTGSIIPGGSAGIKTTVNIKGKPTETK
jgi:hypothetical protein